MTEPKRIGFISTRLAGTDGVSLEAGKWAEILEQDGHTCFDMAGELDRPPERSFLVPKCHFEHPDIAETFDACFGDVHRTHDVTLRIEALAHELHSEIAAFVEKFDLDLLIPENALTIPLNIPLGIAITQYTIETGMPVLAHHHDFFWERKRFVHNACWDYLNMAFPPHPLLMQHAVINSSQSHQLAVRRGISASIVPNVMDFENPPPPADDYADDLREVLGFAPDEKFILQPTRIVQRKGIERAIELVHRLKMPAKLVISHASGDEGDEYNVRVREYSDILKVETVMCSDIVGETRDTLPDGRKVYTLADLYRVCDFVTYPSRIEGFGNAFLEAVYYGCPLLVNNYSIYNCDIRPKGFRTVHMDDYISNKTVKDAQAILNDPSIGHALAEHNYALALKFFSYAVAKDELRVLLSNCFGS